MVSPKTFCEVGCGLGYFTDRVCRESFINSVSGTDISEVAITKAKEIQSPEINFYVSDIQMEPTGVYDCVLIKDVLWYVTPNLKSVIDNLKKMVLCGGYLVVSQSFPTEKAFVGCNVIPNPESLVNLFSEHFDLIEYNEHREQQYGFPRCLNLLFSRRER